MLPRCIIIIDQRGLLQNSVYIYMRARRTMVTEKQASGTYAMSHILEMSGKSRARSEIDLSARRERPDGDDAICEKYRHSSRDSQIYYILSFIASWNSAVDIFSMGCLHFMHASSGRRSILCDLNLRCQNKACNDLRHLLGPSYKVRRRRGTESPPVITERDSACGSKIETLRFSSTQLEIFQRSSESFSANGQTSCTISSTAAWWKFLTRCFRCWSASC